MKKLSDWKEAYFNKFPERIGQIEFLSEYQINRIPMLVRVKYGLCMSRYDDLISGRFPTIKTALDKTNFFKNRLREVNVLYANGVFDILGEYVSDRSPILAVCKYGNFYITANHSLHRGDSPSIRSAVNKDEFWSNICREKHNNYYTYSETEYIDSDQKITVTCPKHGNFNVTRNKHQCGDGCPTCGKEKISKARSKDPTGWLTERWEKAAAISKTFDGFKFYITKCTDINGVTFFKMGRTFNTLEKRFMGIPYSFDVVDIIESSDSSYIINLEDNIKKLHWDKKYQPMKQFDGKHECFSEILDYGQLR